MFVREVENLGENTLAEELDRRKNLAEGPCVGPVEGDIRLKTTRAPHELWPMKPLDRNDVELSAQIGSCETVESLDQSQGFSD